MLKRMCGMILASGLLFPGVIRARQSSPTAPTIIHTTRGEVLFDMVVTDRRNRPVTDLKPDEIQVLDNNVPQKIVSFQKVSRSVHLTPQDLLAAGIAPSATGTLPLPSFNLITIVFGSMDTGSRALARAAAEALIKNDLGPNDYVAIYDIDTTLYALQTFTTDKARLLKAAEAATGGSSTQFNAMNEEVANEIQKAAAMQTTAPSSSNGPPSASALAGLADAKMEQMIADAMAASANADTTNSSRMTLNALLGILEGQQRLPGRKSLIYFTQQMPVNGSTAFLFHGLISAANRANVTFYTVDPTGLSLESDNAQSASMLRSAAATSRTEGVAGRAVSMAEATNSELTENIEYSSRHMMQSLATSTGGFFTGNTNDLRPQMDRIEGDISSHYEISYVPSAGDDGKFHAIDVKVSRPKLIVRARNGYYALPAMREPVLPYEAPMFAVEHATPAPADFPISQAELIFPSGSSQTVEVSTEFPLKNFSFTPVKLRSGNGVAAHFSAMYVVEDMQGNIVKKVSEDFPISGPKSLEGRKMIFERSLTLPAGMYHLRTILYEPDTKKSALQTALLNLPVATTGQLRLSSIAVVGSTEPAKDASENPLLYQNVKIVPDISEPLVKGKAQQVGFFFRVYPPKGSHPQLVMVFKRDGKIVGKAGEPLPAAQADGSVPVLAGFPLSGFPAGQYETDVVVVNGQQNAMQTAFFTVQ